MWWMDWSESGTVWAGLDNGYSGGGWGRLCNHAGKNMEEYDWI